MSETIRWTIKVSKETDLEVRTMLSALGIRKGGLSRFVEDAVRWRVFGARVQSLRDCMRDVPAAWLGTAIDDAVREVRKEARRRKK